MACDEVARLSLPVDRVIASGARFLHSRGRAVAGAVGTREKIVSEKFVPALATWFEATTGVTHPASTARGRLTKAQRRSADVSQGMKRTAAGLDDPQNLKTRLPHGLNSVQK
jgi:O-acetylhomoserine/O-acetylserine sulfhydrylase-like pyridoxal-dependent enzyme